jgi:aldehyde dehydrogenase
VELPAVDGRLETGPGRWQLHRAQAGRADAAVDHRADGADRRPIAAGRAQRGTGFWPRPGEALATSKRIAKIAFTGSTPEGSHILKCAAENIIPCTVELGGKSPNIFFENIMQAEPEFIEKAAQGLVLAFFNQGEVCTCPSRALVQESIYAAFMVEVMKRIKLIKRGNPLDTETMVGAQASQQQFEKIMSYMEIPEQDGTQILTGGKVKRLQGNLSSGYYIQPTLIKGHNKMRVFQEEIFGPVVGVTTFKDEAEALAIAKPYSN